MTINTDASISPTIRVSAIVSAYNSQLYMYGCLVDLTQQTLFTKGELEIVIIDSGSEHNEADVVKEFQLNHPDRIIYKRTNRETLYAAWNRGIELSRGKYLTNANTDDRHRIDAMEIMANTLDQQPEIDLVYGDCHVSAVPNETFESNSKTKVFKYPDFFAPSALLHYQFGPQPMWRKSTHHIIGHFDPSYSAAGDYDFNIRFAMKCKALHIPEVLGLYLAVPTAISFRDNKMDKENSRISTSYHTLDTVEQLYKAAGFPWESSAEKARVYLDMGLRASEFYTPWGKGEAEQNAVLARFCFHRAAELAPDWSPAGNNFAVSLYQAGNKAQAIKLLELISRVQHNPVVTVNLEQMKTTAQQKPALTLLGSGLATPCQKQLAAGASVVNNSMVSTSDSRSEVQRETNIQRETIGSILLVSHGFPPDQIGGTQLYVQALARQLHQSGYFVRVLIPKHDTINPAGHITEYEDRGILVTKLSVQPEKHPLDLGQLEQRFCNRQTASAFKNFLTRSKPDLIHFHHMIGLSGAALESAHELDIPTVLTLHDGWFFCDQYHFILPDGSFCENGPQSAQRCASCHAERNACSTDGNSLVSLMETRKEYLSSVLRFADTIIAPSNYLLNKLSKHGLSHPHIIINPLGLRPTLPVTRKRSHDKVRFAYLGHIMPVKGLDILLRAVNQVSSNQAQLDIYGHTLDKNYFASSVDALAPGIPVQYHGTYAPEDLPAILAQIDVAVIPSRTESFCFTLRECLQAGIPVIASDSGALPEVVIDGENGLLFEAGNHFDLAKKMNFILETPGEIEALSAAIKPLKMIKQECLEIAEIYSGAIARKSDNTISSATPCATAAFNAATRLIAFHLPQFHSIPENDEWWGKGFTEWTNVAKARSLFEGHYQPHVPADLGYYDLRSPSAMKAQADLAREHGLHGFCFYHYWFNGKLLLETPLHQMLQSGQPDFPFCLCWANEDWTRVWDGKSGESLIKQNYSDEDDIEHIKYLLHFFKDERYIKVNGKPLFLVYRASKMPDPLRTTALWRELARNHGIGELYLCRVESSSEARTDPSLFGFDAAVEFQPDWNCLPKQEVDVQYGKQHVYDYGEFSANVLKKPESSYIKYPCVLVSWDNSPRRENSIAQIFTESSPAKYGRWLQETIKRVNDSAIAEKIVFLNAWNEWGEGNHLEPDVKYGRAYLEATKNALLAEQSRKQTIAIKTCTPSRKSIGWGDTYFADALARALTRLGYFCRVDCQDEWYSKAGTDITIHLKGLYTYTPSVSSKNIIWIISHPELVTVEELNAFDLIFCASEPFAQKIAGNCHSPVRYLPQASEPDIFTPVSQVHKDIDLLFVGNNYEAQNGGCRKIIADLLKSRKKYNLTVVGQQWRGFIPDNCILADFIEPEQVPLLYSRAKIVLNDHHREMRREGFINNRTYDLALAEMFQISDHVDGLEKLSVVCYESPADLEEKLDHYLEDSAARELVSSMVSYNCRSYTFDNRAAEIITCALAVEKISTTPLISILIPTYNRARFIPDALKSAFAQNYPDFEVIVVDDGSSDETPDTVKKFTDTRLRYIRKEHSGAPATRNRCITEAKGELLVWLDSDDMLQPDVLTSYADALTKTPDADVLYGDLIVTDAHFRPTSGVHYQDWYGRSGDLLANLLHSNCIPNPGTMVRKSLYEKFGMYNESFRRAHDYELWTRFARKAQFKRLPMKVVKWRWHDSNMSSGSVQYDTSFDARIIHGMLDTFALTELFPTMDWEDKNQDKIFASVYLIIAQRLLELKDVAGACEYLKKSFEVIPNIDTLQLRDKLLSSLSPTDLSSNPIGSNLFPSDKETTSFSTHKIFPATAPADDNKLLVSIIVPTHNRPELLANALESIQKQTFQDFEIIVVNDAGIDVAPLVSHFNTKGTIRYIKKETNQGLAAARNSGIKVARGKYLSYLDDDDIFYPDHLETLVNFLEENPYAVAYSNAVRAVQEKTSDTYTTVQMDTPYGYDFEADRLLVENYIPVLCVMHERKCLDQVGLFDESLPRHEDWDLWIRLSQQYPFAHIQKITAEFTHRNTDSSGMTSGTLPSMLATLERVYEKSSSLANAKPKVIALRKSYLFDVKTRIHGYLRSKVEALFDTTETCNFPQLERVVEQLRETGASNNQIFAAYYHSIGLSYGTHDPIKALSFFSLALSADPVCCPVHRSIAETLIQLGEIDKAVQHCEVILSQEPNDPELMEIMASMACRLGDTKKAEHWEEKAKDLRIKMLAT